MSIDLHTVLMGKAVQIAIFLFDCDYKLVPLINEGYEILHIVHLKLDTVSTCD